VSGSIKRCFALNKGQALQSFGINPGGYAGFYNPETQAHETFSRKGDARVQERLAIKGRAEITRRSMRYRAFGKPDFEKGRAVRGREIPAKEAGAAPGIRVDGSFEDPHRLMVALEHQGEVLGSG
jgi:hypothetical protein